MKSYQYRIGAVSGLALSLAAPALLTTGAVAQQLPVPDELPGLVIVTPKPQAATLERPKVSAPQPAPAPVQQAAPAPAKKSSPAVIAAPAPVLAAPAATSGPTNNAADQVGASNTVLTSAEIERQQIRTPVEALRSLPGVSVAQTGNFAGIAEVRLRGAEANHTLVFIDGIQANDTANGLFDFSQLTIDGIERMEVVRGPQSGLYGTGAVGGVINIITKKARGPLGLTLRTEYGSRNTRDVAARLAGGNDNGYISLSGQWRATDGFNQSYFGADPAFPFAPDKDGARIGSFALNAGGRIGSSATLDLVLRHVNKFGQRDGYGGAAGSLGLAVDDPSTFRQSTWIAGATLKADTLDGKLTHEFKINHASTLLKDFDLSYNSAYINDSARNTFSYAATYRLDVPVIFGVHALTGQVQHEAEKFIPLGDYDDGVARDRRRLSFAGELSSVYGNQLKTTLGVRHDNNDTFQDFTTWRATASWAIPGTGLRPHASAGTAVKMPGMADQFGRDTFFVGNPNLKPEQSRGYDVGLEVTAFGGKALFDVTYFSANLTDKIGFAGFPAVPFNRTGESTREGFEVSSRLQVTPAIALGLAYTYTDARNQDGTAETRRARHSGRIDANYAFAGGKGKLNAAAVYQGSRTDSAFVLPFFDPTLANLPAVMRLTLGASYKIQQNVEVYGRVEDVLDTRKSDLFGYAAPGISVYGGLKVTFDDIAGIKK